MSNTVKIILMIVFFVINVLLVLLLVIPNLTTNAAASIAIELERENHASNTTRLNQLIQVRDEYNTLNAEYQTYSMQLPSENDISVFTNDIYDIAKYSGITINAIDYAEQAAAEEKEEEKRPEKLIEANFTLEGSYYNIINFIMTIEKMPRIVIVEDFVIQSVAEEYKNLNAFVTVRLYYISD
jgi:Tfp pilus assembly protein PilO